jgi:hypothetical protein
MNLPTPSILTTPAIAASSSIFSLASHQHSWRAIRTAARKTISRGIFFTGLSVVLASACQAAPNMLRIGSWLGGPSFKNQSKDFEKCTAQSPNPEGIVISYSVDSQFRWRLAFSNPAWNFSDGYALSLLLRLGEQKFVRGRATATGSRTFEVETGDELALFTDLWMATGLQVTAGGLRFRFELTNSNEVLSALLQCAARGARFAQQSKTTSPLSVSVDPSIREEARSIAQEILAEGRTGEGLAYQRNPTKQANPTVTWKNGLIVSALDVIYPAGVSGPLEMPVRILERDIRRCRNGLFFAWSREEIDQVQIARAATICPGAEATTFAYYAAAPRSKGGYYLLASTMLGSGFAGVLQQQLEGIDARQRSLMVRAVNRIEQQESSAEVPARSEPEASPVSPLGRRD